MFLFRLKFIAVKVGSLVGKDQIRPLLSGLSVIISSSPALLFHFSLAMS